MNSDDRAFLLFKDWISSKEHLRKDWITVARFDDFSNDSFGTFSVLAQNDPEIIQKVLISWSWNLYTDFGKPYFSQSHPSHEIRFHIGDKEIKNGISFEAFTILREFHTAFPSRVDIAQSFVFYHGLYFELENNRYIEPINEEPVIKYVTPCFVQIKTSYIEDYLAARNMILVRFHDHRRCVKKPPKEIIGKDREEIKVIQKDRHFFTVITRGLMETQETISRLLGKDIILPFKEPRHRDFLFLSGKEEKKFVRFIIGFDAKGKIVEETCNEEKLSNNFVDRRKPHFLTPVFFKREVLQKYYQNPRRYTVSAGYLKCLDLWGIPFDINKEGLVHVWLGDLGSIPYTEQLHFRQYNVSPSGSISEKFYRTQILAQFVEPNDIVYKIERIYDEINELSENKLGFRLFRELSGEDSHIYKSIHIPTTTEYRELDEQLIFLAKLLPDSISKSELEAKLSWRPSTQNEDTKIRYLEMFLEELFALDSTSIEQIVQPMRNLQRLRSASAAHPKCAELKKALVKMELEKKNPQEIFVLLVHSLVGALSLMRDLLKQVSESS